MKSGWTVGSLLAILAAILLFEIGVPFIAPYSADRQFRSSVNAPPCRWVWLDMRHQRLGPFVTLTGAPSGAADTALRRVEWLASGSAYRVFGLRLRTHLFGLPEAAGPVFLLGSDSLGRDLFSRLLFATRFSILAALLAILLTLSCGTVIGALSGYLGGWVDRIAMRVCDLFLSLPGLFLVLGIRALLPIQLSTDATLGMIVLIFVLLGWAAVARVVRGQVLSIRSQPHVLAARGIGASHARILFRHVLPLTTNALIVQGSFLLPMFVVAEITLSFLGVGVQEPNASLGTLLRDSATLEAVLVHEWKLIPAAVVFCLVLSLNLVADQLKVLGKARGQWW
ncbi:MAG: ABC transporter permease [Acidobacteriota bacterium]